MLYLEYSSRRSRYAPGFFNTLSRHYRLKFRKLNIIKTASDISARGDE